MQKEAKNCEIKISLTVRACGIWYNIPVNWDSRRNHGFLQKKLTVGSPGSADPSGAAEQSRKHRLWENTGEEYGVQKQ